MEHICDQLHGFFPEMDDVANKDWVRQACSVWEEALRRSRWKNLSDAPFGVATPGITLLGHTKAVLHNALGIARNLREVHQSQVEINYDVLIISCILHDVDKLLAFEPAESGELRYSEIARTYQHGFYSAYYAERAGLPASIVTLLINHTALSRMAPSTIEGMILFYADIADADLCKFIHGQSSSLLKSIGKTAGGA
ncbi:HD domain-containing protein [Faecalispora jeddahensis]|uniref:HD domain-containing protein n=1 Tax=Faecalispora jeddahensis TaxID=1414721 RepID=UPI0028AE6CEB|nr:HD domain-containing protein [Faecalispora jeddahensis]